MSDKYELAKQEARHGAAIPLGAARVRPSYKNFITLRESGQTEKGITWAQWQRSHAAEIRRADSEN